MNNVILKGNLIHPFFKMFFKQKFNKQKPENLYGASRLHL